MKKQNGLTLVEVIIAIVLLAFFIVIIWIAINIGERTEEIKNNIDTNVKINSNFIDDIVDNERPRD